MKNQDLNQDHVFVSKDLKSVQTDIRELASTKLCRDVYFRPSSAPLLSIQDSRSGSCFENWWVPTASFDLVPDREGWSLVPLPKNLVLDAYVDQLHDHIQQQIISIYQQHQQVMLCYSGGIDSMVILSYVIKLKLLNRTRFICYENHTQNNATCLHKDQDKKQKLLATIALLSPQLAGVDWLTVTEDALSRSFNTGSLQNVQCYCTTFVLQNFQHTAIMYGHHGNQALLHKDIFVDEILLQNPAMESKMQALINGDQKFYSQPLRHYDMTRPRIGIEHRYLQPKPWHYLTEVNNNKLYTPLADNNILRAVRQLDFGKIELDVIADAQVARELIRRNVGNQLEQLISTEGVKDSDNLEEVVMPMAKLHPDKLFVPTNLNHDAQGLEYVQNEIDKAQSTGVLPLNSLVAIKALQWLGELNGLAKSAHSFQAAKVR